MQITDPRVTAAFTLWDDTFDKADVTAIVALYTPDAWLLAGKAPAYTGSAALTTFFQTAFSNGMTNHVLDPFDLVDLGTTLVVSSNWTAQVIQGGKVVASLGGTATHVLQQQTDGSMKLRVHTFNFSS